MWTSLRLLAEVIADADAFLAASVFAAADRDPAAPRVTGRAHQQLLVLRDRLPAAPTVTPPRTDLVAAATATLRAATIRGH